MSRMIETIEPDVAAALQIGLDSTHDLPSESPTVIGPALSGIPDEMAEKASHRRFRVHQPAPPSLESEQADSVAIERAGDAMESCEDAWAANVLAVCGGLLMLAGILYVAVDVAFWF